MELFDILKIKFDGFQKTHIILVYSRFGYKSS